ncbi:pyridoxamine 5'-phosphate oxidase family protein [Terrisporobacter mayombei]|uniref:Pyridoxamine 5'-phosphate oxidase family protein n=1 Tax=Terrisporobacter mayombei TaxID=1541 RepID=A0ABY9PYN6_9FIRM|nr:pyridoxamine 5'-phosphate oxidase family protein [Terrisporobacter mayombei]MCC3866590.1 pyridoxamine 5'-phosphate oxidase family protein [Terrisporobacter mayombei]WMT80825.1 hypothetical protein TEMA_11470 [Terrisporobacter mayombei]
MQNRMKKNQLSKEEVVSLLDRNIVASLATIGEEGKPYVIPVHYVYYDDKIYVHGLPLGEKVENIKKNGNVSMTIYKMGELILAENGQPCGTNTRFESAVIKGKAIMVEDITKKEKVLKQFINKFTPHLSDSVISEGRIKGTGIIEIAIDELTGKFY